MKKTAILILSAVMCFSMVACGSGAGRNLTGVVEDWKNDKTESSNKISAQKLDNADFGETLGFDVTAYPDDINLKPENYFALEEWFGQIEYIKPDDSILVLRVAKMGGLYLASTYDEIHSASDETITIDGVEVRVRTTKKGAVMHTWQKGDFQFLLHSNREPATDEEVARMVEEVKCKAA